MTIPTTPSVSPPGRRTGLARPARAAALIVAALTLLKLLVAPGAGLVTDEAHYALYGLHLDWSYFDHPPLVGWLQALVLPLSQGELALRLWPIALSAAACALLYALVRRLFPDESPWTATVAVALWATAPIVFGTGLALVPESALVPLALLAMHALISVLRRGSLREWLLLALALGLAGLSKYTSVSLVVTVAGALVLAGRASDLRTPGPWLAVITAAVLVAPVVLWNAAHGWISFRYQLRHGTEGHGWSPTQFALSRLAELMVYGPALVLPAVAGAWQAARRQRAAPGVRLLALLALPVLVVFWPSSGREFALPHWTQLAWLAGCVLAARWYVAAWKHPSRRWIALAGGAWCASFLLLASLLLGPGLLLIGASSGLRAQVSGWDRAALLGVQLCDDLAQTPGPAPMLFTDRWTRASRLAFYGRPAAVQVLDARLDQFDLWFGEPEPGARGILVSWETGAPDPPIEDLAHFAQHELVAELPIEERGVRLATFRFWACHDYRP